MPFHPKYLAPNGFTAMSMVLGLASMITAASGDFTLAAWMIVWGVLLDTLDGAAARLLRATSEFGAQFDSFSDFVVFGLAPAALVYFRLSALPTFQGEGRGWMLAGLALYSVATAIRLARFNIDTGDPAPGGGRFFVGIPSTAAGGMLALMYLTWERAGLGESALIAFPAIMVAFAVAMVSRVRLPKLRRQDSQIFNLIIGMSVLAAYTLAPLRLLPELLLAMTVTNIVSAIIWAATVSTEEEEADTPAVATEGGDGDPGTSPF